MKGTKTGGRAKGTPNKTTGTLRKRIATFLEESWDNLEDDFNAVEPYQRLQFFEKLLQYSLPRLQSISHDMELKSRLEALSEPELDEIIERIKGAENGRA